MCAAVLVNKFCTEEVLFNLMESVEECCFVAVLKCCLEDCCSVGCWRIVALLQCWIVAVLDVGGGRNPVPSLSAHTGISLAPQHFL